MQEEKFVELSEFLGLGLICNTCNKGMPFPLDAPAKLLNHTCPFCDGVQFPDPSNPWIQEVIRLAEKLHMFKATQTRDPRSTKFRLSLVISEETAGPSRG
jgi:hypothetical protein